MRVKIPLLIAALSLALTAAAAERAEQLRGSGVYGVAGCGLGSMVFGNERGAVQVLAATTNGTGFQTFAITSGTSNCGPGLLAEGTKNFVDANREILAKDISRGSGETIGALTVINACEDSKAVGVALQSKFSVIFPSETVTNDEVTRAILETLQGDLTLGCGRI